MARLRKFIFGVCDRTPFPAIKHFRFQLLFFLGLVAVPLLCGFGRPAAFGALAGNLLCVEGWKQAFSILFFALISSWTGMVMVFIVRDLGWRRFAEPDASIPPRDDDADEKARVEREQGRRRRLIVFALPVFAPAIGMLVSAPSWTVLLAVAEGLVLAAAVALVALWITTVIYYLALPVGAPDVNLLLPESTVRRLTASWRQRRTERTKGFTRSGIKLSDVFAGYVDKQGLWYAQHLVMTILTGAALLIYVLVVGSGYYELKGEAWAPILPAFSYLELGWLLAGVVLTSLAFFFDGPITLMGFHLPVLVLVVIFVYWNSSFGNFYQLVEPPAPSSADAPLKPEAVIDKLFPPDKGNQQVLTVVCAAGGGILASAWTALALTGLESKFGPSFTNSVGLISSVSGGSVASMYYLDRRFQQITRPDASQLDLVEEAEAPSLSAALWGLIGPAPFRFLTYDLSFQFSKIDRGWALEQVWRGTPPSIDSAALPIHESLSEWREALRNGKLPAVVFNATSVESGYPVLIGTTEIPDHGKAIQIGAGDGQYGYADIAVATAARLSASFTYVSPVASAVCKDGSRCPEAPCYSPNLDDGGYFDNPGVWSAVKWLEAGLQDPIRRNRFKKIVILELWAFPFDEVPDPKKVNQLFAPATTLLNVRTASQLIRGDTEIQLLKDKYGGLVEQVILKPSENGPLSWMLSKPQEQQIKSEWDNASHPKSPEMKTLDTIYGQTP